MLQTDRQRKKMQGVEKMLQTDRQRKNVGGIDVCLLDIFLLSKIWSQKGRRRQEKRAEWSGP